MQGGRIVRFVGQAPLPYQVTLFFFSLAMPTTATTRIINAMTVDVEDYFQVSAFETYISRDDWDRLECRVEQNVSRIIEIFSEKEVRATFFTLGWIAERYPEMVKRIVASGHELACHGYSHIRANRQTPEQFRDDVAKAKNILEDIGGVCIKGYRAASYSIGNDNLWALKVLEELGFDYSSSIYPVRHDLYGMPNAPRFPFSPKIAPGLLEVPITTIKIGQKNIPCGGGGFFRLFPYNFSKWAIKRINQLEKQPSVFYFHPWEIDPGQPKVKGINFKTKLRHYLNLNQMEARLLCLLSDFRWDTMENVFLKPAQTEM